MPHASQGQHLRAILRRGHMPDLLAFRPHRRRLRPDIAVGVDLHLHAAIAEDALGHDRDRVHPFHLRADDERCGLIIRVGRPRPDPGDEHLPVPHQAPVPGRIPQERHHPPTLVRHPPRQHHGIEPHQPPLDIPVPIARPRPPRPDPAQDRAGIAGNEPLALLPRRRDDLTLAHARMMPPPPPLVPRPSSPYRPPCAGVAQR
jgi:hypothetical protein